jgi:hypothetical protein
VDDGGLPGVQLVVGQRIAVAVFVVRGIADATAVTQGWKPPCRLVSAPVLRQELLAVTRLSYDADTLSGIDFGGSFGGRAFMA